MALVLSIGFDHPLLHIRTILLEGDGHQVRECHSAAEVLIGIEEIHPDVVMICHSVPKPTRDHLVELIHELDPHLPLVCIEANSFHGGTSNCCSTENDPELLLAQIRTSIASKRTREPPPHVRKRDRP